VETLTLRKSAIQILAAAVVLIIARLAFDFTSAAAYVYPELDFGQNGIAFAIFIAALLCALIFALVRFLRKRFIEGIALLIICYAPFSFDDTTSRQFWKFRIHRSEYQSVIETDPGPSPKFRVFNWGNRNTQLMGGGVLIEGIVYDESDDFARWSPEWIERRPNLSLDDRWIAAPSKYPSCKMRIEPFGDHYYYVAEEC
jgi:hypothetical protein